MCMEFVISLQNIHGCDSVYPLMFYTDTSLHDVAVHVPVSYTHLDVYKRQELLLKISAKCSLCYN